MKKRILIVEDEDMASKALERKFRSSGYDAFIARDGEEALQMMQDKPFDAVLLDLVLPKKDGYEVLEEMLRRSIMTPVIVVSNLGADVNIARSKELGAKEHLIKSMTPMKQVVTLVENLLK